MAVTIVRTNWIDDDGTGTTGTVINNAVKTALYNDIDGALAKVAQLAGGNTFAGNQTVNGALAVSGAGPHTFSTASVERIRIASTGELLIGTPTMVPGYQQRVGLVFDGGFGSAYVIQNSAASNLGNINVFLNAAGGLAGYINQTSASSVSYTTTSDQRLKVDGGRATDLAALRAVVIHDFTWMADGVRDRGVFAQEAHALYPRAITAGTDETTDTGQLVQPWGTDYSKFVPDLIVGWQQHEAALAEFARLLVGVKGSV
jgi:hypothetical protein